MPAMVYWAIPAFLGFIALEYLWLWLAGRKGRDVTGYERSDSFASLAMGIGNLAVAAFWKTVALGVLFFVYRFHIFRIPADTWWAWALMMVGDDFCYYWFHRFGHRVRFGWAAHENHHSSTYFNYTTALRQSWTFILFKVWFYWPLALVGFHPLMIVAAQAINLLYQFWVHTEAVRRLPAPLEWLLNTPSHHRVHHGANAEYVDKNYGGIFIFWDRLFGTFEPERARVRYGLRKQFDSRNPFRIAFHEWAAMFRDVRNASGWTNRLGYIFRPPGWQPGQTEMQQQ